MSDGSATRQELALNPLSRVILDCSYKVHTALGPGLLESAYHGCLLHEMKKHGLQVESEVTLPVRYDGVMIDVGYRIDLLVEKSVVVELKAIEKLLPVHQAQVLSYLKMSGLQLGFLINFNVLHLKEGIKRIVNNFRG